MTEYYSFFEELHQLTAERQAEADKVISEMSESAE